MKVVDGDGRRQAPRLRRAARGQARQRGPGRHRPSWRICAAQSPPGMSRAYAPAERLTRDGPALACTGDGSVRGPVRAARRVRVDCGGHLRAGPGGFRPLEHGSPRTLALPAVLRAGRRGRSLRGAAGAPGRAGRAGPGAPAGRVGPGRRQQLLQLDACAPPSGRARGVRADARDRRAAVRVLPAGNAAAHSEPGRPHAERAAVAAPGRALSGSSSAWPPTSGYRRRKLPAGSGSMPQPGGCTTSARCSALTSRQPALACSPRAVSGGPSAAPTAP